MENLSAALRHFKKVDPTLHAAAQKVRASLKVPARKPRRGNTTLFGALASAVVSQQLATKAAQSIWERVWQACGGRVTAETVAATPLSKLRKAGLSGAKAKTLKALAKEVNGGLSLASLRGRSPEEASEALTHIWGVGPWTAEMFLMFGLGHPDIFSARDLGLVRSMETLYGLKNPSVKKLETIALAWSPHRTVACRILWRARDGG